MLNYKIEMNRKDKIRKIIFHLGKGIWKGLPLIGPIVEEVIYEANKDYLIGEIEKEVAKIPIEKIDAIIKSYEENERRIQNSIEDFRSELLIGLKLMGERLEVKPLILKNRLAEFKEKITNYAFEYENKMQESNNLMKSGKTELGQQSFLQSLRALNKIVRTYKLNSYLFDDEARVEIGSLLNKVENTGNETPMESLIIVIQLINSETMNALEKYNGLIGKMKM